MLTRDALDHDAAGGVDSGSVCKIMNEDFSIMRYIHHQEEVMHLCKEVTRCRCCATSKSVEALVSAALVAVPSH